MVNTTLTHNSVHHKWKHSAYEKQVTTALTVVSVVVCDCCSLVVVVVLVVVVDKYRCPSRSYQRHIHKQQLD